MRKRTAPVARDDCVQRVRRADFESVFEQTQLRSVRVSAGFVTSRHVVRHPGGITQAIRSP
jgi:hypothetical protein